MVSLACSEGRGGHAGREVEAEGGVLEKVGGERRLKADGGVPPETDGGGSTLDLGDEGGDERRRAGRSQRKLAHPLYPQPMGDRRRWSGAVEKVNLVGDRPSKQGFVCTPAQRRPLPLLAERLLREARDQPAVCAPPQAQVIALALDELLPGEQRAHSRARQGEDLLAAVQLDKAQRSGLNHRQVPPVRAHLRERLHWRAGHLVVWHDARWPGAHHLCLGPAAEQQLGRCGGGHGRRSCDGGQRRSARVSPALGSAAHGHRGRPLAASGAERAGAPAPLGARGVRDAPRAPHRWLAGLRFLRDCRGDWRGGAAREADGPAALGRQHRGGSRAGGGGHNGSGGGVRGLQHRRQRRLPHRHALRRQDGVLRSGARDAPAHQPGGCSAGHAGKPGAGAGGRWAQLGPLRAGPRRRGWHHRSHDARRRGAHGARAAATAPDGVHRAQRLHLRRRHLADRVRGGPGQGLVRLHAGGLYPAAHHAAQEGGRRQGQPGGGRDGKVCRAVGRRAGGARGRVGGQAGGDGAEAVGVSFMGDMFGGPSVGLC
eukprot:scaffold13524_cov109-Isochrysis_galbana.AAC.8